MSPYVTFRAARIVTDNLNSEDNSVRNITKESKIHYSNFSS